MIATENSEPESDHGDERAEITLARTREQDGGDQRLDEAAAEQDTLVGEVEERDACD